MTPKFDSSEREIRSTMRISFDIGLRPLCPPSFVIRFIHYIIMPDNPSPLRILGIDPGLNITGYGVLDWGNGAPKVCEAGVVRGKSKGSLAKRLLEIHQGVSEVIESLKPDVMAVEELYSHYERPRTAILMGHARGVIVLAAMEAGIPVLHYSATQIKKILTGNGRAPKAQVQRAIQRELALKEIPDPPDVADALAIALCHGYLKDKPKLLK